MRSTPDETHILRIYLSPPNFSIPLLRWYPCLSGEILNFRVFRAISNFESSRVRVNVN